MPELPLTNKITADTIRRTKFRAITADFGDGYSQTGPRGLNPFITEYSIRWAPVTEEEKALLISILENTYNIFQQYYWKPPMDTYYKRFRITPDGYTVEWLGKSNVYAVTCNIIQVYDY